MSLSVAEIDHHDEWQRSTVGIAIVAGGNAVLEKRSAAVQRMLSDRVDLVLLEIVLCHLEDPE